MEDKTKLVVFDRIEVILIFLFMIITAITSFTLGVKIGRDHSFEQVGFAPQDQRAIEIKSAEEEEVMKTVESDEFKAPTTDELLKDSTDFVKQELNTISRPNANANQNAAANSAASENANEQMQDSSAMVQMKAPVGEEATAQIGRLNGPAVTESNDIRGKVTIQIGAYRDLADAQKFADGFRVRQYNPIINEVILEGKGTWYRVSLGLFDSVTEAKAYITNEKTLFDGQEYVITEIK